MAINIQDDYAALERLIYPSIEASGNVYYGQTKKLLNDAVFNKNEYGFEASIQSEYDPNTHEYKSYYVWKLGPLSGKVRFNPLTTATIGETPMYSEDNFPDDKNNITLASLYDDESDFRLVPTSANQGNTQDTTTVTYHALYGLILAKYKLNIESVTVKENLHSGMYHSYERHISCEYVGLYNTQGFNPTNKEDYNTRGRNFYIGYENDATYLYIQICYSDQPSEVTLPFYDMPVVEPLTIKAVSGSASVKLEAFGITDVEKLSYEYRMDNLGWAQYDFGGNGLYVEQDHTVQFRCVSIQDVQFAINKYVYFSFGSGSTIELSGDLRSMANESNGFNYFKLFNDAKAVVSAPKLGIEMPKPYMYAYMLSGTSIKTPPKLPPCIETVEGFYYKGMLENCTELQKAPTPYISRVGDAFQDIISGCTGIKYIDFGYVKEYSLQQGVTIADVLQGGGTFIGHYDTIDYPDHKSHFHNIDGWEYVKSEKEGIINIGSYANFTRKFFGTVDGIIQTGADHDENGRGTLVNPLSIRNSPSEFDEYGRHPFNTYNKDGSLNQEIWGYKSFNSPVLFRNGIYSDGASILSSLPSFDSNITAFSVSDTSSGTIKQASINAIDYDLLIKFTGNARYREVIGSLDGTQISTSIVQDEKHIARFFSVDHTKISLDIESYIANNASTHSVNYTGECSFTYSELTVPGKASVYVKEKPSIYIVTDGDSISESAISSTVEAGIKVDNGVIRIEAEEGKPCDILISTGNGDMDMMIEMYHYKKDPAAGQEYDRSEVTIKLGNVTNTVGANAALIKMTKRSMDISTESSVYMGITDENGSIDKSCIEINSGSGSGTHALIKADYVSINGNVQVNGTPINNT